MDFVSSQVVQHATTFLGDWLHANFLAAQASVRRLEVQQEIWVPPAPGFLNCNIDAGFSEVNGKTTFGICIKNNFGQFVLTNSDWIPSCLPILEFMA